MKDRMKILVAYDGSESAQSIFYDLRRAGLPDQAEAVVISIDEQWMPLPNSYGMVERGSPSDFEASAEVKALAKQASERLSSLFPEWNARAEAYIGSPASFILVRADDWQPDLIFTGARGSSTFEKLLLGSISQKVMAEADCSVRIARGRVLEKFRPVRILIGYDGSIGADAAVQTVLARRWPAQTAVKLVTAVGPHSLAEARKMKADLEHARRMQMKAEALLSDAGFEVSTAVNCDTPIHSITHEAEQMGADCIFVGTNLDPRTGRFVPGRVATAIAARAHCSVEVVRPELSV